MKIEIIYNPYLIQTDVMIDGKPVDDAYSALFPVRNYPLQSWLDKNGSWAGCGATFAAIARGEKLSILFHGRQEDFDDFQERIYAYPWEKEQIEAIQYEPAFQYKTIRGALDNIFELLKTLDSYHGDGSHRDESLIKRVNLARRKWDEARDIVEINNPLETDQKELLKNDNNLCVMECEKTALETRYKTLDYFCRGMRRCPESLVFSESDEGGVPPLFQPDIGLSEKISKRIGFFAVAAEIRRAVSNPAAFGSHTGYNGQLSRRYIHARAISKGIAGDESGNHGRRGIV